MVALYFVPAGTDVTLGQGVLCIEVVLVVVGGRVGGVLRVVRGRARRRLLIVIVILIRVAVRVRRAVPLCTGGRLGKLKKLS